ncbi:hypothetical protein COI51_27560 [Bacillus toyonensis]|nr:hypothetical protein [Bacillus toyonensis]OTW80205.1 hypothetical protein BK702_27825 [Bacillus thuringiensis serovar cameroun]OTX03914.1 hypothetical protein BK712_21085 [Bacillus thuringiensis serovar seoulensis]PEG12678.1 hypothetical protein COO04_29585 [Bacillus toyonensis]PEK07585.1 hypothetical protein CN681_21085 [Bacillus toyonensis]
MKKNLPTIKNSKRHVDYCQDLCGKLNVTKRLQEKNQGMNFYLDFDLNTYINIRGDGNYSYLRRWCVRF